MQLGRYQVSTLRPPPILSITFSQDGRFFTVASETGYEVWTTFPLGLIRRRSLPGTLARALPLPDSPLLVLQGGGASPLYPPNKAIVYHDSLGVAVAELEFGERVRGIVARRSTICIALSRRVVAFEYGLGAVQGKDKGKGKAVEAASEGGIWMKKLGEWETAENEAGLMALATSPGSTLLALPGRQPGHAQLVHLPPCPSSSSSHATLKTSKHPPPAFRSPIILAHTHPLSALACTATGSHLLTASERGTLIRVWDTARGRLERELRRGVDRAEMWGAVFEDAVFRSSVTGDPDERRRDEQRRKGGRVIGWSDKGTVHVWGDAETETQSGGSRSSTPTGITTPSLTHILSRNLPLPKYFSSTASSAQYHLPRKNPHAFASTIGAAAGAAGVPSIRLHEGGADGEAEWAERFVVSWIEVEVEVEDEVKVPHTHTSDEVGKAKRPSLNGGGMGTREERRSFGSDATSRTATPTLAGRDTPPNIRRQLSGTGTGTTTGSTAAPKVRMAHERSFSIGSGSRASKDRKATVISTGAGAGTKSAGPEAKKTKMERQLVAITYSGDWYRLRIPEQSGSTPHEDDDPEKRRNRTKCELVEYRRLSVGGGGW